MQALLQFMYVCPIGLIAFDDEGVIEWINPQAVNLLVSGLHVADFTNIYTALDREWPELRELVRTDPHRTGLRVRDHRLRGERPERPAVFVAATVEKVALGRNAMVVSDVTATAQAEVSLRASEARLRTLFDSIDEGYCLCEMIVDPAGEPIDYRFVEVNPTFEEMTGLIDPVGRTALELVPDLEFSWIARYAQVGLDRETVRFEQGSDAMGRWFEVFSMPVEPPGHFAIVFKDQTERRAATKALQAAADVAAFRVRLLDALRASTDTTAVQESAAGLLGEFLGAARVHYIDIDGTGEHGEVTVDHHVGVSSIVGRHRLDDYGSVVMDVFRAGRIVVCDDVVVDERLTASQRAATLELGIGSHVLVPVVKHGRTSAGLAVHYAEPHQWTAEEVAVIEDAAERTSVAMERIRDEESARTRQLRAELLAELLAELESHHTVEQQLEALAELLVPRLADYVSIETPLQSEPLAVAHRDPTVLETLRTLRTDHRVGLNDAYSTAHVAAGQAQLISEITAATLATYTRDRRRGALLAELAPRSHMAVPLDLGNGTVGALVVGLSDPSRVPYTPDDLSFLREAAQRVGVVLAANRLRHEEHSISVRLQRALLPDSVAWHPNVLIEARYEAASHVMEVGGDWYDTFTWPNGHIGIVVGDVVGHNLESAAVMGHLRAAAAALAMYVEPDPGALLEALDRSARGPDGTAFATVVCVILDPATGELKYSSAGHPPILVIEPDGTPRLLDDAQGLPLCALATGPRATSSTVLQPGSLIVMYTDGLIERRTAPIDDGLEHLRQLAVRIADESLDRIADQVIAEMARSGDVEDDVVVVACRYAPPIAVFEQRFAARADQLGVVRAALRRWLGDRELECDDVLVAIGEACANAVEHAYEVDAIGEVDISITDHGYYLTTSVVDRGTYRPPRRGISYGGRGTRIMQLMATRFARDVGSGGTVVTMTLPAVRTAASTSS